MVLDGRETILMDTARSRKLFKKKSLLLIYLKIVIIFSNIILIFENNIKINFLKFLLEVFS